MSGVRKRSVTICGHGTSFWLQVPLYDIIISIATSRGMTLAGFIAVKIDESRDRNSNLSSALRFRWVPDG